MIKKGRRTHPFGRPELSVTNWNSLHLMVTEVSRLHGRLQRVQPLKPFCFLQPIISVHGLPPGLNESCAGLTTCTSAINKKASPELLLFQGGFLLTPVAGQRIQAALKEAKQISPPGKKFQGGLSGESQLTSWNYYWWPQGDSNPCYRRERPVSWTESLNIDFHQISNVWFVAQYFQ